MTLNAVSPSANQVPRVHVAPRASKTYGDLAADLASDYGLTPDPWQRLILDDWLGERGGQWSSLTCGLSVPRQNGKNALIEIRELFGMLRGERILHTAHEVKTAQKHFRRLKHFFGAKADDPAATYPELNARVTQVRSVNGQEAIFLDNGGSVELVARSKNSGRGFTVDVLVMDEAQEMAEDALEALMPTTSASPKGNPQWIFTGTPPGPSASGEVFTRVRAEALGARQGRLCWHEWSVDGEVNLDDRSLWRATNPALGIRLQSEVLEGERSRFSDGGFARERLGRWDAGAAREAPAIAPEAWEATAVPTPPAEGIRSLGVKFSPDGSRVAVSGALKHDGGIHVELVGAHSGSMASGTASLVAWVAERAAKYAAIVVDGKSHAGAFVNALREAGVSGRAIVTPTWPEVATANSMLVEAVIQRQATHLGTEGQKVLDDSVAATTKKLRGTEGAWSWSCPSDPGGEVPIASAALAHWGAKTSKRNPGRAGANKVVVM